MQPVILSKAIPSNSHFSHVFHQFAFRSVQFVQTAEQINASGVNIDFNLQSVFIVT